ncbi:hypothetical protein GV794_02115 [Nocardia cyriacigeorgica]|uniref:SWIM-type domain-containing protein n=1 Tax=Nocardia cyriacigeorgica TaxID=135487 RepID=A0ABX0CEL7_9NOCA|nr:hypothetical protein [Nocardia cyriacigeorgica]NEW42756.1 hypothetical protein [Nocardia cyriacigeorgica]NEW53949.1 hypothetical protein [Nocardia cyriacigeorgica]NEW54462.1 hypothetical protein [Nocardia cyriacigeorgica]
MNTTIQPRFRQVRIGVGCSATPREIEIRYRCIEARHEGLLYNRANNATYCMCGRAVWPGDCGRLLTAYERAERDAVRMDSVGVQARSYLDRVHGHTGGAR